jgi:D-alanyl-D-alanine carboxypeptidase
MRRVASLALMLPALAAAWPAGATGESTRPRDAVGRALEAAVDAGVPGAAVLVTNARGDWRFYSAGYGDVARRRPIRRGDRYRIASMSKAFNAAVVLSLARDGRLRLSDTVARWLPGALPYGGEVTIRDLLGHRGGVPSYTATQGFARVLAHHPRRTLMPSDLLGYVDALPPAFPAGSAYAYSNTDNVLLGLIVERATGGSYASALRRRVLAPLRLRSAFLAQGVRIPGPHVHGYELSRRGRRHDATTALSPSGAWASGAIVATADDVGRFFRAALSGRLYGRRLLRVAMRSARPGDSSPPGPGANAAGLGLFRYRLPCGVAWGHTGLFPGYRNLAVASPDGRRSAVVLVNGTGAGAARANRAVLRLQRTAACAALRG